VIDSPCFFCFLGGFCFVSMTMMMHACDWHLWLGVRHSVWRFGLGLGWWVDRSGMGMGDGPRFSVDQTG
jgi:hypothetical protein